MVESDYSVSSLSEKESKERESLTILVDYFVEKELQEYHSPKEHF